MPKVRVYEIAKELDMSSKDLIDLLKKNSIEVKSHSSSVDEHETRRIISREKGGGTGGSNTPGSDTAHKPAERQSEQKTPSAAVGSQRLNIWREDSGAEKVQRENLQKEVIRQKQQAHKEAQKDTHKSDRYPRKHSGDYNTLKSDNGEGSNKTGSGTPSGQQRSLNRQDVQAPERQASNRQQTSSTPNSQYPRRSSNEARPQRDQSSSHTQQARHTAQEPGAQQSQRTAQTQGAQQTQRTGQSPNTRRTAQGAQPQRNTYSQNPQQRGAHSQNAQGTQQAQRGTNSSNTQQPQRTAQSPNAQQPHRASQSPGTQQPRRNPAPRTEQTQTTPRSDSDKKKDFSRQKPTPGKQQTGAQRPLPNQKGSVNQRGPAQQKTRDLQKLPSAQKPPVPKKRSSKKIRASKQAEAELLAAVAQPAEQDSTPGIVFLPKMITVKDLAVKIDKETGEVIKALMKRGIMANLNQEIDYYNAAQVAEDFEILVDKEEEIDLLEEAFAEDDTDNQADMTERSPVVVVMGHVDHGKTSLLDRIRKANVTVSEAGGITQHIGAYTVTVEGKSVTFLDTPGHEAFTAMRMRGAQVTDIAVLVVAADDGVMPQTIEAINHAKAANVEIIVAINKTDRPSANPDRVKQELADHGLLSENWGGDTICVEVSAITGAGIDNLLEMITVVAEMKELKVNAKKRARGTVIEAMLDKGRGPVATVLVQSGTLSVGDPVVAGATYGKIRAMSDDKGQRLKTAGPSMPVEILGLSEVPLAGDMFYVAKAEKHARVLAESVKAKGRESLMKSVPKVSLDDLFDQIQSGNVKELNLVIKADVQGSVEAVRNSLERLSNNEVRIRAIHGGVGAITESDVMLASASNAIIIGFNVRPEAPAKAVADSENVDIRLYRIIYNAIEDITAAMKGLLDPVFKEKVIGHAEIRQLFKASGVGTIAGSYVTDGKFTRNAKVRIIRNSKVVYDGTLETLKRFKDDVKEVNAGYECGLLFTKYNDIKEDDKVEAYIMEEIQR